MGKMRHLSGVSLSGSVEVALYENTERSSRWRASFSHVSFIRSFHGFDRDDVMQKQMGCRWWVARSRLVLWVKGRPEVGP